ncbi:MAG: M20/M25/M40 family metallo-hydrolase [Phycisphaerales bacterium]|nr:M20/M25/M40 family metallo-hydrolase [Planctomycetota bacterium]MCH8507764.1 M20/M25/M40 family metallo-hydrolase [Phycisphaerales bacterium]
MTTPARLLLAAALLAAGSACNQPRLADRPSSEPTPESISAKRPAQHALADARISLAATTRRDGNLTVVQGQPTMEQIQVFAADGGTTVINLRPPEAMAEVPFDQRAVTERAGMRHISIPATPDTITTAQVEAFARAIESVRGPVMLHCGTGSTAGTMWAAYLATHQNQPRSAAIARGKAVGMQDTHQPVAERLMLEVPDRVMAAIDPANLRQWVDRLAEFGTRHTLSDTESDTRGIGAARRWVAAEFERVTADSGRTGDLAVRVEFDPHAVPADGRRLVRDAEVVNVVCTIPGADPASRNRLYYVLAHLDSRASDPNDFTSDAPGANDDASGVAALIELARVLSRERLDSTIVLMATSGEEQGLFGARLHAQAAKAAGKDIRAVLNNDTIGDPTGPRTVKNEVRVFSEGLPLELLTLDPNRLSAAVRQIRNLGAESDGQSRQLARYIHEIGELHRAPVRAKMVFRPDRFLRGGDHTPFNELGFPAVRFTELYDSYDRQHQDIRVEGGVQYGDLPEFVDADYLADVTRLNAIALVHMANAPSIPANARIIVAELTNDTTLRWDPSPEPDVAGYEIVWRDTASPVWQHRQDVGNRTEGTVPRTKDNSTFGVRAYDRRGYRSPVAFPVPGRE